MAVDASRPSFTYHEKKQNFKRVMPSFTYLIGLTIAISTSHTSRPYIKYIGKLYVTLYMLHFGKVLQTSTAMTGLLAGGVRDL